MAGGYTRCNCEDSLLRAETKCNAMLGMLELVEVERPCKSWILSSRFNRLQAKHVCDYRKVVRKF